MRRVGPDCWDAIIVGAGPAGSATAIRLARAGHRVLLLDRGDFPRAKPCGECVNPAGVRALEALGALTELRAQPHTRIGGWRIWPAGAEPFQGDFPPGEWGLGISRWRLDRSLLALACASGATVRTGARVGGLAWEGERVAGVRIGQGARSETLHARLVIGADGLRSVVVRKLELLRRRPRLRKLALTTHVNGAGDLGQRGELHVFEWGCLGIAAVGEGIANVTVVVQGKGTEQVGGGRESFMDSVLERLPRCDGMKRASEVLATGPFDWPTRRKVAEGALLVGDAAGYFDPFTGQGIYRALRGGELAAVVADEALRHGDTSARALSAYERAHRRAFAPGERLQHLIELFVSRPRLLGWAAARFRRHPELADALIAVTGDLRPARSLLSPELLARMMR